MAWIKHWLSTIEIIDTEPRIQYSSNYCIDIVLKAKLQYRTSLLPTNVVLACNMARTIGLYPLQLLLS